MSIQLLFIVGLGCLVLSLIRSDFLMNVISGIVASLLISPAFRSWLNQLMSDLEKSFIESNFWKLFIEPVFMEFRAKWHVCCPPQERKWLCIWKRCLISIRYATFLVIVAFGATSSLIVDKILKMRFPK